MAAKTISISDDGGSNFYNLPGNTGDWTDNAKTVDDTIFGQNFKSSQSDLIDWMVTANAFYKGYAGYTVVIKQSGATTSFTTEATTLVSGKTYKITNAAKNAWDPAVALTVFDNAVDHTADVLSINFLFGQITFKSAYTPTGPITITGSYFPLTTLAKYQKYNLTQTMSAIDITDCPTAQGNGGNNVYGYGLKTVALSCDGIFSITNAYRAALAAKATVLIEVNPDGGGKSVCRGYYKPASRKQSGQVGALEVETMSWELQVPAGNQLMDYPFNWKFTSSDLTTSVQKCLNAFIAETVLKVKYLPDGGLTSNAGLTGDCVISNISLSGGMGSMNEFSVSLQGASAVTAV